MKCQSPPRFQQSIASIINRSGGRARARCMKPSCAIDIAKASSPTSTTSKRNSAFTLIELLVAITILMILAAMTFSMVNASLKGDQIRTAARQIQSYVEGARDRALHAGKVNAVSDVTAANRGVRFLRDPNNPAAINAMVFIQAQPPEGNLTLGDIRFYYGAGPGSTGYGRWLQTPATWVELRDKGLLDPSGSRIDIAGIQYTMTWYDVTGMGDYYWVLTKDYVGTLQETNPSDPWADAPPTPYAYSVSLQPTVMPNQEPRLLPSSILIDLVHSRVPWGAGDNMDIMFSPRGTVSGSLSAAGNIHLLLADVRDIERGLGAFDVDLNGNMAIDPNEKHFGESLVVSITTNTGKVTSHPVYFDVNDPFRYAEIGEEAK